ncbi:MAG: thioredoxin TrxC [Deltaproteobacteria bacterium]|nr:thioredoxin TrxC [Deltaproteobacteria bacterium]
MNQDQSQLIVCAHCGAVNGIPKHKSAIMAKCGNCKQQLLPPEPREVNGELLLKSINRNTFPLVVDFWAPWCGPCKMMAPQFATAAANQQGSVVYLKLNTETAPDIAAAYNIRSIPTMALFQGGREVNRTSGAMDARRIQQWVDSSRR